jgi:hypothetical protein
MTATGRPQPLTLLGGADAPACADDACVVPAAQDVPEGSAAQ